METVHSFSTEPRTGPRQLWYASPQFSQQYAKLLLSIEHHYEIPVNCSNEIAQVSIFLGIVCSVIMGASRWAGDLIMSLVFLLLDLAFQNKDGGYSALDSNTLSQIPISIDDALSRFNLDGHTTIYAFVLGAIAHMSHVLDLVPTSPFILSVVPTNQNQNLRCVISRSLITQVKKKIHPPNPLRPSYIITFQITWLDCSHGTKR